VRRVRRAPERTIAARRMRRERTRENSAATKNPLRSTSARMAKSREITPEKYHNGGGGALDADVSKGTHIHAGHEDSGLEEHSHAGAFHFHGGTGRSLRIALV